MSDKRFTLREPGQGPIIMGLADVSSENAGLMRLAFNKPLESLDLGEATQATWHAREHYEVVRTK